MPRNGSKEDTDGVVVMGDGVAVVGGEHWVTVNHHGDSYYTLFVGCDGFEWTLGCAMGEGGDGVRFGCVFNVILRFIFCVHLDAARWGGLLLCAP